MDKRNFLLGFAMIFTVIFFLVGLAIYNRLEQRALAAVPLDQTATAERAAFIETLKFGLSPTPTVTPSGTPRPAIPTFTASPMDGITNVITATLPITLTPTLLVSSTPSGTPAFTRTPGPSPTDTAKPTFTPTGTITPETISLVGRVLLDGIPAVRVALSLEDPDNEVQASATTGADGTYTFANLAATSTQFNVFFAQENNTRFGEDDVLRYAWFGPIQLPGQGELTLPDLEIAPLGFGQLTPGAEAEVSAAAITAFTPLAYTWTAYPGADEYWVDLYEGDDPDPVWQSDFVTGTIVSFDGVLDDGSRILPGDYWWGIGATKELGDYTLKVNGLLAALTVTP